MGTFARLFLVLLALLSFSLTPPPAPAAEWRDVTDDRLTNAGSDPANWLMYSRTYNGWRYSPLDQINTGNIKKLAEVDLCGRRPRRAADDPRRQQRRDVHDVDRPGRQPGARAERRHRRAPVETRPEDPGGRRRPRPCHSPQPRRGPPQGQGDLRHARRPSRRPRRQDGQAGMGDEDRGLRRWVLRVPGAAGHQEQGDRGHRWTR